MATMENAVFFKEPSRGINKNVDCGGTSIS